MSMFDNVKQPEDIFEGVEAASPPPISLPESGSSIPPVMPPIEEVRGKFPWKAIVVVLTVVLVIGAAAALAYVLIASRTPVGPEIDNAQATNPLPTVQEKPVTAVQDAPSPAPSVVAPTDRDKDGLSDADEAKLGTSPTSPDTDADGLFDKEEVQTYHTDPLNPDTDGDGYLDGGEVKGGYDPNGPGKLFGVPAN